MEEASGSNEKGENSKSDAKGACGSNSSTRSRDKKLTRKNSDISCKSKRSVKRKLKPFSLGKWQKSLNKEKAKKQTFNLDREICRSSSSIVSESSVENVTCICTGYRKTKTIPERNIVSEVTIPNPSAEDLASASSSSSLSENFTNSGLNECNRDLAEATYQDLPNRPSDSNSQRVEAVQPIIPNINEINITELTLALRNHLCMQENLLMHNRFAFQYSDVSLAYRPSRICRLNYFGPAHTQVDYIHHLVPGLQEITNCSFYWGKMDRYKAEKQLDKKPEGTFLLRDSAQEEYLFSVSFRRYGRTLHARIEQLNHKFSFDSHDPNVFAASTVCGLLEHYKNPRCCMFFEPMLTLPVHRKSPFDLQHLCRSVISDCITYDNISQLKLPKQIKSYLKEYHYKEKVRVRHLENDV